MIFLIIALIIKFIINKFILIASNYHWPVLSGGWPLWNKKVEAKNETYVDNGGGKEWSEVIRLPRKQTPAPVQLARTEKWINFHFETKPRNRLEWKTRWNKRKKMGKASFLNFISFCFCFLFYFSFMLNLLFFFVDQLFWR